MSKGIDDGRAARRAGARRRPTGSRVEAAVDLERLGHLVGAVSTWPDRIACAVLQSEHPVATARLEEVRQILKDANAGDGGVVWELGRDGRLALRLKGRAVRGDTEARIRAVRNQVFGEVQRLAERMGDVFVIAGDSQGREGRERGVRPWRGKLR